MKSLIATALVALSLVTSTVAVQAADEFSGYPDWAQRAFDQKY